MSGGEIVGDVAQGALLARAVEPEHGESADGHTHEADNRTPEVHANSERVAAVQSELRTLDDDGKRAVKEWANGRSLAGSEMLTDEAWLERCETHIDEQKAS